MLTRKEREIALRKAGLFKGGSCLSFSQLASVLLLTSNPSV